MRDVGGALIRAWAALNSGRRVLAGSLGIGRIALGGALAVVLEPPSHERAGPPASVSIYSDEVVPIEGDAGQPPRG